MIRGVLRSFLTIFAIAILVQVTSINAADAAQRRLALVIGIDDYEEVAPLKKAENDADAMSDKLQSLGFEVVKATNVGRRGMSRAVLEFEKKIEEGDLALFFYAGHGFRMEGQNYLLPADIPAVGPEEASLVKDEAFLADTLADRFRKAGASATILVLDACRNNPFAKKGTRSLGGERGGGLAAMNVVQGMFVLYSAGETQTALDRLSDNDPNPNSVFTRVFLEELEKPQASIIDVAKSTRARVFKLAKKVGHNQFPSFYDQIIGDLTLNTNERSIEVANALTEEVFTEGNSSIALPTIDLAPAGAPQPTLITSRSNAGWSVYVNLPEAATQFGYKIGEEGEFKVAGYTQVPDPRTNKPMPNFNITLPREQEATDIYVTWRDKRGEEADIYKISFDPDTELFRGQKSILEQIWTSWLSFRDYNGQLVYLGVLSYRCAVKEVKYSIDGGKSKIWPLPKCNKLDPFAIPEDALNYIKIPKSSKTMNIQLTYIDGTKSEVKDFNVIN